MALIHLSDRVSTHKAERKLHPALCLAGGFGFIVGGALLVHVVFNALI